MMNFKENEIDKDEVYEEEATDEYDYSNEDFFEDDDADYNYDEEDIDYCD